MAHVPEIRILRERCRHCGDCVTLCPQSGPGVDRPVFTSAGEGTDVRISHVEGCISCFTCVEFCRAAAIVVLAGERWRDGMPELTSGRPEDRFM